MLFQIMFLSGIFGLMFFVLIFCTCVCLGGKRLVQKLATKSWYQKLRSFHCWFWWGLFVSMLVHIALAFYLFGWPF